MGLKTPRALQNTMAVDMSYAGRIYLNPMARNEVWCNFGWNTGSNQIFPPYPGDFSSKISKSQYDTVLAEVQKTMDENKLPGWLPCCMAVPLCCCCAMAFMYSSVSKLNSKLKKAGEDSAKSARISEDVEVSVMLRQIMSPAGGQWLDTNNQPCMGNTQQGMRPMGPPLGYNIVIKLPESEPVMAWPPNQAGATAVMAEPAMGEAVAVASAPAADDPMQQIAMLKSLLDSGALTQAEFDSKKAALLAKV